MNAKKEKISLFVITQVANVRFLNFQVAPSTLPVSHTWVIEGLAVTLWSGPDATLEVSTYLKYRLIEITASQTTNSQYLIMSIIA